MIIVFIVIVVAVFFVKKYTPEESYKDADVILESSEVYNSTITPADYTK